MPQCNPAPGNEPGLPVDHITRELADLRDQMLLLMLIFDQPHAGQKIEEECAARVIALRLADMLTQADALRAHIHERAA